MSEPLELSQASLEWAFDQVFPDAESTKWMEPITSQAEVIIADEADEGMDEFVMLLYLEQRAMLVQMMTLELVQGANVNSEPASPGFQEIIRGLALVLEMSSDQLERPRDLLKADVLAIHDEVKAKFEKVMEMAFMHHNDS